MVGSCLIVGIIVATFAANPAAAYLTFGQGFSSKWGDDPQFGTGAIVTWGYMLDGTEAHPSLPDYAGLDGTSQIGTLRSSIDGTYGGGAFDAAIQNAFDTWSAAANITFVGPLADSGLPAGQQGSTSPQIRIGAFHADPDHDFRFIGAIGYGPTGIVTPEEDFSGAGDVFFNLDAGFQVVSGTEDGTLIDYNLGNDLEGLFLHELGHAAIGLGHPPWAGEDPDQRVMYVGDFFNHPEWPECCYTINRQLHADDVAGAQYVYGVRGDYNRDGRVDAADYTVWRDTRGQNVTSGSGADGNVDGMVDQLDYELWTTHFGDVALAGFGEQPYFAAAAGSTSVSVESNAVPEPATWIAVATLAACALLTQRGRFLCLSTTHRNHPRPE